MVQEGRRERKKRQTREVIVGAAFTLFAERGFEAVTVTEIADRADVARATLFSYFPTKESIVLGIVGDDDPAAIVAARAQGTTPLDALRSHYRTVARAGAAATAGDPAGPDNGPRRPDLLTCVRVITQSPTLTLGVTRLHDSQRTALARVLAAESGAGDHDIRPDLVAAQICAVISALQSRFFGRLAAGESYEQAAARLPGQVELAFDLLQHGIGNP
jgi:AcrR family transcriptional regulator